MKIPTSSPVMVTGATGYVGGVLVQQLLGAGLTVHCPVRDPTNEAKIQHLKDLEGAENLKFFKADLLDEGSYEESMKGCSVVFHVASPFKMNVPKGKEEEELIEPAVKGTLNVLETASGESSVKRVVVTSSIVAIATDGTDTEQVRERTGKMCNEESWNESATIEYNPYAYSKTLAEKAAWKHVEENDCGYDLVVCNPGFVMGPGVKVHETAESYIFVKNLGTGIVKSGCPDLGMCIVDVRDVARGHIAAGFLPSETVAGQRYILNGRNSNFLEVSQTLLEEYPTHPLPKSLVPKWIFWCAGPLFGVTRKWISRAVGHKLEQDNSKSLRDLNLGEYRSLKESMTEMFAQCIDSGYIPAM